jgi:FkbM family methyltransferase
MNMHLSLSVRQGICALLDISPLDVARLILRKFCGRGAAGNHTGPGEAGYRKQLSDIRAASLADGAIEIEGVRFHRSYPSFARVLVENVYCENYNFSLYGSWVVVDIGANAGATSLWLARQPNVMTVYAFEPVSPTYQMLLDNIELNPSLKRKVKTFHFGLGGRKETLQIPFHPDHAMSISSKGTFDECFSATSIETVQIEAADSALAALLSVHSEERVFLKIDCEGAEYDILPNLAAAGLLRAVDVVIVEWHGGDYRSLVRLLESEHLFCFIEWHQRNRWQIGMIKAVRLRSRHGETSLTC